MGILVNIDPVCREFESRISRDGFAFLQNRIDGMTFQICPNDLEAANVLNSIYLNRYAGPVRRQGDKFGANAQFDIAAGNIVFARKLNFGAANLRGFPIDLTR